MVAHHSPLEIMSNFELASSHTGPKKSSSTVFGFETVLGVASMPPPIVQVAVNGNLLEMSEAGHAYTVVAECEPSVQ